MIEIIKENLYKLNARELLSISEEIDKILRKIIENDLKKDNDV